MQRSSRQVSRRCRTGAHRLAKLIQHPLAAGFVDIHNHGVGGSDAGTMDVTAYWTNPGYTCRRVARHGTTSVFATVTFPGGPGSDKDAQTVEALNALELVVGRAFPGCAVVEGVHAEGPLVADLGGLPESTYNVRAAAQRPGRAPPCGDVT